MSDKDWNRKEFKGEMKMKRLSYILLAAMLVAVLAVSCTAEVIDDAELATIMFASGDGSRSLVVSRDGFDAEQYVWYYTAAKSDNGPGTGAKSEKTLVGGTGKLTSPIEGISLGKWDFQLFGYDKKIDEGGVVVYTGSAIGAEVSKGHDNVISVKVEPQKNGTGYIDVSKDIVLVDGNGNATVYNASNVEIKGLDTEYSKSLDASDEEWKVKVPSGSYAVTVRFVSESGTEHASTTKYFNVYDGLTTKVSGTLEEVTSSVSFDVKSDDIGLSISENKAIGSENVYEFGFSPVSSETTVGKDEHGTTITGSFKKTDEESDATISLVVYNTASAAQRFSVVDGSSGDAVVAGFDFTLSNATIEDGNIVQVSTHIGTGYTKENLKVVYKGNPNEVFTIVDYDSSTGVLIFETSHFSEYYVTTSDARVLNENTKQKYIDLQDAIDNANDGDTIKLLSDVVLENTVVVEKRLTLSLDGKTISNTSYLWNESTGDWSLISVRGNGDLTITGNGTLKAKENDCFTVDVQDINATVTIESGTLVGNIHAVYVEKGSAYINGGIYSVQQKYSASKPDEFVLNCYDPNYQGKDLPDGKGGIRKYTGPASIVVTGGKFENFNPADCYAEGAHTNFVAEGYISVKDEGSSYTVREKKDSDVAMMDGVVYDSLASAIEKVPVGGEQATIIMLNDVFNAEGISVDEGKNFIVDFAGHKYLVCEPGEGSLNTQTNAFQLKEGSKIVFKNGTIGCTEDNKPSTSKRAIFIVIQNYCDLTLDNMVIDGTNLAHNSSGHIGYIVSVNSGDVVFNDTRIIAGEGDVAFDSCKFSSYAIPTVTVSGSSKIDGRVEATGGKIIFKEGSLDINSLYYTGSSLTSKVEDGITWWTVEKN